MGAKPLRFIKIRFEIGCFVSFDCNWCDKIDDSI